MGEITGISWTHHTFNPWLGCQRVSPACGGAKGVGGCYAESLVTGRMGYNATSADPRRRLTLWGPPSTTTRHRTSAANWRKPLAWDRAAKADGVRRRVFCASLADVFEAHPDLPAVRADLWPLIEACDGLDWQLLTKRPENIRAMVPPAWRSSWPAHVWVGTTAEDQRRAEERIPHLLAVPAAVRFLSVEPMLEAVDLDPMRCDDCGRSEAQLQADHEWSEGNGNGWCNGCDTELSVGHWLDACADGRQRGINWVIVGGESGPGARHFGIAWARSIVEQCDDAGVPVFCKQMGDNPVDSAMVDIYGPDGKRRYTRPAGHYDVAEARATRGYDVLPHALKFKAHHGADPSEWPADLQRQEFPNGGAK